jgi:predicted nucleic acid-binding protein
LRAGLTGLCLWKPICNRFRAVSNYQLGFLSHDPLADVFADTVYWIALVVKQDQYHRQAQAWTPLIRGRITTTTPVLLETANALARPAWRASAVALIEHLQQRPDVQIIPLEPLLWQRGWDQYRNRTDKAWSLTDCVSFLVMEEAGLTDALGSLPIR